MPMQPAALKSKMKETIYNGLKKQFNSDVAKGINYPPEAEAMWQKLAEAISDVAADIIMEIQQNAEVLPGIPTVGGPAAQVTVAPGKIN